MTTDTPTEKALADKVGDALDKAFPGQVERNVRLTAGDPKVQRAVKKFRDTVTRSGGSVTITAGDKSVTIGGPVPTAQGPVETDHNQPSGPELPLAAPPGPSRNRAGGMNVGRLKGFIERVEKLEEERAAIGSDIRDVYSEAKGVGYDIKTIRKIIQLRKMDAADRDEQEALLDVYKHALGMP